MLTRLDRLDEAEARFRESLRCDPRFPQAHYQLGITLEKKRSVGEAVSELEEAVRLDPADSEAQYALARRRTAGPVSRRRPTGAATVPSRSRRDCGPPGPEDQGPRRRPGDPCSARVERQILMKIFFRYIQ